jgi:hypothetical protein
MCDKIATSSEHVPPKCLFPEQKDLSDGDLRKQLLKVPSCDEHNSKKSQDDEYFVYSLVMLNNRNEVAKNQYFTKVRRAITRNPSLLAKFAQRTTSVNVHDPLTGETSKSLAFHLDETRFNNIIDRLARALHYKHFNTKYMSHIKYQAEYLLATLDPRKSEEQNKPIQEMTEQANGWFTDSAFYGANPEVFKYQVLEASESKIIRLFFYEGCKLLLFFR